MKYSITINQVGIANSGLAEKTDLADWAIIDYLKDWFFAETKKTILNHEDGKQYTWLNYNHLIQNMPLLPFKNKDGLSKRIKKLKSLNLIKTIVMKDNSLYFILTDFCISTCFFQQKKQDEPVSLEGGVLPETGQGVAREGTGGVDQNRTAQLEYHINNNINISNKEKESIKEKENKQEVLPNVFLKKDEIKKLIENYTLDVAVNSILKLYIYLKNSRKKYKDHYLVLHNWVIDEVLKSMGVGKSKIQFDKEREEQRKEYADEPFLERQKLSLGQLFRYNLSDNQLVYDEEVFENTLKEKFKNL